MAQAKFYLEKRLDPKTKEFPETNLPILLAYSFNGQRLIYYTGLHVDKKYYIPEYWKGNGKHPIKTSAPRSDYIINQLDIITGHIHTAENEAKAAGKALSVEYFREYLNQKLKDKPAEKETEQ